MSYVSYIFRIVCYITILLLISYTIIEPFRTLPNSRSVELYNPSAYNGLFIRKFETPIAYTRTHVTYPLTNQLSVTKNYLTHGSKYNLKIHNQITPLWNIPNVYPLVDRRQII